MATATIIVLLLCFGFLAARSLLSGPVPPMSLVPALPDEASIVRNETEYSDGAGGNSARVLVLRSPIKSPDQLANEVAASFDNDSSWQKGGGSAAPSRTWQQPPGSCDGSRSSTTASVTVELSGAEVEVGQFDSFIVDAPAVVVRISTFDHVFCGVGTTIR